MTTNQGTATSKLSSIVAEAATEHLQAYDREFFERVWATSLDVYRSRLRSIGFTRLQHVLDAGSGNGQWTLCLAELNERVTAVEVSEPRLNATRHIFRSLNQHNATLQKQSIASLSQSDNSVDAVYCYSVLMFCDHQQVLREFHRVLKPGGALYICTNGIGWYLYNVASPHNESPHFDVRQMALDAIDNTINYFASGVRSEDAQLALPSSILRRDAVAAGFSDVRVGPEGTLCVENAEPPIAFFQAQYLGMEGVYELLAYKS